MLKQKGETEKLKNFQIRVIIDMDNEGYAVKIASSFQRARLYASIGGVDLQKFDKEMMYEKYRIIVTDKA